MQDRYFVYLLSAGDGKWGYIGQTNNISHRFLNHKNEIRKGLKSERWNSAIEEFPNADDWEITEIAGPFSTPEEAICEEARLQEWAWDEPGRLWDKLGNGNGPDMRKKVSDAKSGENHHFYGKKLTKEHTDKMSAALKGKKQTDEWVEKRIAAHRGAKRSQETKDRIRAKAIERGARKRAEKFFAWLSDPIT